MHDLSRKLSNEKINLNYMILIPRGIQRKGDVYIENRRNMSFLRSYLILFKIDYKITNTLFNKLYSYLYIVTL